MGKQAPSLIPGGWQAPHELRCNSEVVSLQRRSCRFQHEAVRVTGWGITRGFAPVPPASPLFQASNRQAAARLGHVLSRSVFSGKGPCFLPGTRLIPDNAPSVCEDTHVSSGSRPPASRAWAGLALPADSRGQPGQSPTADGTARNQPFLLYVRALIQRHGNIWVGPSREQLEGKKTAAVCERHSALIRVLTGRTRLGEDAPSPEGSGTEHPASAAPRWPRSAVALEPRFPPTKPGDTGGGMPVTPANHVSMEQPEAAGAGPALPAGTERCSPVLPPPRSGTVRVSPPQWFIPAAAFPPSPEWFAPPPPRQARWLRPLPPRDPPVFLQRFRGAAAAGSRLRGGTGRLWPGCERGAAPR